MDIALQFGIHGGGEIGEAAAEAKLFFTVCLANRVAVANFDGRADDSLFRQLDNTLIILLARLEIQIERTIRFQQADTAQADIDDLHLRIEFVVELNPTVDRGAHRHVKAVELPALDPNHALGEANDEGGGLFKIDLFDFVDGELDTNLVVAGDKLNLFRSLQTLIGGLVGTVIQNQNLTFRLGGDDAAEDEIAAVVEIEGAELAAAGQITQNAVDLQLVMGAKTLQVGGIADKVFVPFLFLSHCHPKRAP